ncbi:SpoIID/LytB domain-containing protein [Blastococcus sp. CT_GayMR20]|uniref:SpoIID/LytB domain-containing protein n=1 Tax=Blastococcus sp. CT_GayMR20 TaxID=2559609 RepID=UPI0010740315|nr:SpoIID/LytB domain-containing protein [Blastococcus sp. CT_GayMR20]TFV85691.1 SpoIID/LytB domain-containing protein [Blastococcus sp. CT_GayMR20]
MRALTTALFDFVRRPAALIAAPLVAVLAGTGVWLANPPSAGADATDITFNGRGFGHGRGLSQWGAYGYAVDHSWSYQSILDRYYGGTTLAGDAGNPAVSVELLGQKGKETVLTGSGLTLNGYGIGAPAMLVRGIARNTFEVYVASTCAGPWAPWGGPNGVRVEGQASVTGGISLCDGGQVKPYRGNMVILDGGPANLGLPGFQTTVNVVTVDEYLYGVVPRESPASWGSAGGGKGMHALRAQAVAARSYALSSQWTAYAKTCDTTSCQVYGGSASEDSRTTTAVAETSGQVRRRSNGTIARTEFSASTGGWTAGGEFPAVEDAGDLTGANPNRSWSASFSRADVAARLGIPQILNARVTVRNGLGAEGGRVVQIVFDTTGGARPFTGNHVRSVLGLKSDWFTPTTASTAGARSFSRGLYADILGREGEPQGVDNWTGFIATGGDRYAAARAFAGSGERFTRWVGEAYTAALHRPAEPDGMNNWVGFMLRGGTLNELNGAIYGSTESLYALGGGDVNAWVNGVYQSLLGRPAAPIEQAMWASAAGRYGRTSVAMSISQSAEARDRRLAGYYLALLGRPMDSSGQGAFSPYLAGRGDVDVVASIAASAEYRARVEARFP